MDDTRCPVLGPQPVYFILKSTAIQEVPGVAKFIETEGRTVVTRGWSGGQGIVL